MSSLLAQKVLFTPHDYCGSQLVILIVLAWHANPAGWVEGLTIREISRLSRINESGVNRVLNKLISSGAITRTFTGGRGRSNQYQLNLAMFNKSKRSVAYQGGVDKAFLEAELEASMAQVEREKGLLTDRFSDWKYVDSEKKFIVLSNGDIIGKNTWQKRRRRALEAITESHLNEQVGRFIEELKARSTIQPNHNKESDLSGNDHPTGNTDQMTCNRNLEHPIYLETDSSPNTSPTRNSNIGKLRKGSIEELRRRFRQRLR